MTIIEIILIFIMIFGIIMIYLLWTTYSNQKKIADLEQWRDHKNKQDNADYERQNIEYNGMIEKITTMKMQMDTLQQGKPPFYMTEKEHKKIEAQEAKQYKERDKKSKKKK